MVDKLTGCVNKQIPEIQPELVPWMLSLIYSVSVILHTIQCVGTFNYLNEGNMVILGLVNIVALKPP